MPTLRHLARCSALIAPLAVAACSGDVNPIKAGFIEAGYGPKTVAAPDFVAGTRKTDIGYMPVGESAPRPAVRARSAEGQKSLQAELEGARGRNEARGRAAEGAGRAAGKGLPGAGAPAAVEPTE